MPPMGQGPYAAGRDGASVDAAAAVDRALGVCASVTMPAVSDTRASCVEVPGDFWEKGGLRVALPRVFIVSTCKTLSASIKDSGVSRGTCQAYLREPDAHEWVSSLYHVVHCVGSMVLTVCGSVPGFGRCQCGVCHCNANRTGRACECSGDTDGCVGPEDELCSGHGHCKCNRCQCLDGYYGALCDQCPGCKTPCERHR